MFCSGGGKFVHRTLRARNEVQESFNVNQPIVRSDPFGFPGFFFRRLVAKDIQKR